MLHIDSNVHALPVCDIIPGGWFDLSVRSVFRNDGPTALGCRRNNPCNNNLSAEHRTAVVLTTCVLRVCRGECTQPSHL